MILLLKNKFENKNKKRSTHILEYIRINRFN